MAGATPGLSLVLANASGHQVGRGTTDALGSLVVRNVAPGPGYTFRADVDGKRASPPRPSGSWRRPTPRPLASYASQHLHAGLNYLTMRDGVRLAATVRLPLGATMADAPFPTVIEDLRLCRSPAPTASSTPCSAGTARPCRTRLLPSTSTAVGSLIAPLLGFATVSLQMRGTGCSGGAFDLFGLPTTYDGYDAVQIAAAQPWVAHHKVGLVGISFSGISQLFVAGTRPPGLAAVAPDEPDRRPLLHGVPRRDVQQRVRRLVAGRPGGRRQAGPGRGPALRQGAHRPGRHGVPGQPGPPRPDPGPAVPAQPGLPPGPVSLRPTGPGDVGGPDPCPGVPVGAFQDEQTGGQWPAIVPPSPRDPHVWVTLVNGTHADSLGPGTISRWLEFLDIFVAQKVPTPVPLLDTLGPPALPQLAGAPSSPPPPVQYTEGPTLAAARTAFEAQPRIRVLMDNGSGDKGPGALQPVWQAQFPSWPPRDRRRHHLPPGPVGDADPGHPVGHLRRLPSRSGDPAGRGPADRQPVVGPPALRLDAGDGAQRARLHLGAAPSPGHRHRAGLGERVGEELGRGHRSAGHGVRGPSRRLRAVRPERRPARQRPGTRPRSLHAPPIRSPPIWPPRPGPCRRGGTPRCGSPSSPSATPSAPARASGSR